MEEKTASSSNFTDGTDGGEHIRGREAQVAGRWKARACPKVTGEQKAAEVIVKAGCECAVRRDLQGTSTTGETWRLLVLGNEHNRRSRGRVDETDEPCWLQWWKDA